MKQIIRLTESDLHNIIKESVRRILSEDGEGAAMGGGVGGSAPVGGDGATNCAGVGNFQYDVPFGGLVRRTGYNGHKKKKGKKKKNQVDMSDAFDRTGGNNHSIAVN